MSTSHRRFDFALLFDGEGGARELSDAEVDAWSASDGVLWVDCDQAHKPARTWLVEHSNIHRNLLAIVLAGETRPRSLAEPDGVPVPWRR